MRTRGIPTHQQRVIAQGEFEGLRFIIADFLHSSCAGRITVSPLQIGYVRAAQAVKAFVQKARKELGLDVYAYSVFHIFFEQYGNIRSQAAVLLGAAMCAVAAIVLLFTGSAWASALILAVLLLIEVLPLPLPTPTAPHPPSCPSSAAAQARFDFSWSCVQRCACTCERGSRLKRGRGSTGRGIARMARSGRCERTCVRMGGCVMD